MIHIYMCLYLQQESCSHRSLATSSSQGLLTKCKAADFCVFRHCWDLGSAACCLAAAELLSPAAPGQLPDALVDCGLRWRLHSYQCRAMWLPPSAVTQCVPRGCRRGLHCASHGAELVIYHSGKTPGLATFSDPKILNYSLWQPVKTSTISSI